MTFKITGKINFIFNSTPTTYPFDGLVDTITCIDDQYTIDGYTFKNKEIVVDSITEVVTDDPRRLHFTDFKTADTNNLVVGTMYVMELATRQLASELKSKLYEVNRALVELETTLSGRTSIRDRDGDRAPRDMYSRRNGHRNSHRDIFEILDNCGSQERDEIVEKMLVKSLDVLENAFGKLKNTDAVINDRGSMIDIIHDVANHIINAKETMELPLPPKSLLMAVTDAAELVNIPVERAKSVSKGDITLDSVELDELYSQATTQPVVEEAEKVEELEEVFIAESVIRNYIRRATVAIMACKYSKPELVKCDDASIVGVLTNVEFNVFTGVMKRVIQPSISVDHLDELDAMLSDDFTKQNWNGLGIAGISDKISKYLVSLSR